MTTLAVMKARIASELRRSDLTAQIAAAISTAISEYQKERFRFSETIPDAPPTFNTVAGRFIYTSADNANISTLMGIDYVDALIGGTLSKLTRRTAEEIKLSNDNGSLNGQPMDYAYEGGQLLIGPVPDKAYTITLGLFRSIPEPANDGEIGNPWMTTAELLIRSRAKYELALHVTRNAGMAKAMSPYPPEDGSGIGHATYWAWVSLKGSSNRVASTGRVRPMQF